MKNAVIFQCQFLLGFIYCHRIHWWLCRHVVSFNLSTVGPRLFIDNEKNYCAWNPIRIIEGSDNWGSDNRGSTVKSCSSWCFYCQLFLCDEKMDSTHCNSWKVSHFVPLVNPVHLIVRVTIFFIPLIKFALSTSCVTTTWNFIECCESLSLHWAIGMILQNQDVTQGQRNKGAGA